MGDEVASLSIARLCDAPHAPLLPEPALIAPPVAESAVFRRFAPRFLNRFWYPVDFFR
jgi:hypothetical protein